MLKLTSSLSRFFSSLAIAASVGVASLGLPNSAAAAESYKLLSLLDYSGPFANRGKPVEQMQKLLVDWYNDTRGAKQGVKLELDPVDTGYDQAKTVQAYERAVQDPNLIGVVTFGSPNVIAIQSRLPRNKIPAVHGGPAYSLMEKGSWVFTPLNDYGRYFAGAVDWRLKSWTGSGPLKVAYVTFDGSSGRDWAKTLADKIKGKNATLAITEYVSPRALEVGVNVERVLDIKPDLVILASTDQLQPLLLAEFKSSGFDMTKIVNSQHEGLGLLALLGVAAGNYEGTYEVTTQNYADTTTEAYKIYDERKGRYATRWSADTLLHFTSVLVMLDAVDRAVAKKAGKRITGDDVNDELKSGTFDGRGLLGKITFDNALDPTLGAENAVMLQQKNGAITRASDFFPLVR